MMIEVQRISARRLANDRRLVRRVLVGAAVAVVTIAFVRTVIAPPEAVVIRERESQIADPPEDALAASFAAAYLGVDTSRPEDREAALRPFGDPGQWPADIASGGSRVARSVVSTRVAQVAPRPDGSRVVVVQSQMSTGAVLWLAVRVQRSKNREVQIVGSPAIVGPPAVAPASESPAGGRTSVDDPQIREVITRALRNLLGGRVDDLRADLTPSARISVPPSPLSLVQLSALEWTEEGSSVLARVRVTDADSVEMDLDYELDLFRNSDSRWLVAAAHLPY